MQFQSARADIVRAINQRWLLKTWVERRAERAVPGWQELSGRELASMANNLCFLDVIRKNGNVRFLMRHHSAWLGEVYGFDCHDQFLDEMKSGAFQDSLLATYRHVVATRYPVYASADIADRAGHLVHYERLLLPFGQDGETVDRILASIELVSPDGAFDHRQVIVGPARAAAFSVYATIQPT